jgi:hypothetical protein
VSGHSESADQPVSDPNSITELDALARHARARLALYRRRIYLGRGQATKLAELERIATGAEGRARRARVARASVDSPTLEGTRSDAST